MIRQSRQASKQQSRRDHQESLSLSFLISTSPLFTHPIRTLPLLIFSWSSLESTLMKIIEIVWMKCLSIVFFKAIKTKEDLYKRDQMKRTPLQHLKSYRALEASKQISRQAGRQARKKHVSLNTHPSRSLAHLNDDDECRGTVSHLSAKCVLTTTETESDSQMRNVCVLYWWYCL